MISEEEYEVLKGLDNQWKWIARDLDGVGDFFAYSEKPAKDYDVGVWGYGRGIHHIDNHLFQFIQWEDSEPYNISELIEEYDNWVKDYEADWNKLFGREESEETEVKKGKKGLVKYLEKEISNFKPGQMVYDYLTFILKQLNQLDEYEVLSPEWIDEYAKAVTYDGIPDQTEVVYVDDLQNIIVPKQEEVDQAYKDGYETGKQHTFYKGYLEGLADKGSEPETIADVVTTFWKSYERLKEVMSMEVEELEE